MHDGYEISFDNIHRTHKKCTPKQKMKYQIALKLNKLINEHDGVLSFEHVTVMDQIICTSRQINFQIYTNCNSKIGQNTSANKLYRLNNEIGLNMLNLHLTHYKKLVKIQFLKYGKT